MSKYFEKIKYRNHEEWLQLRASGVGGSDISAIMGLNKYRTIVDVWRNKVYGETTQETEAMRFGKLLEPIIAKEFSERYNIKVVKANYLIRSKINPVLIGSVDYFVKDEKEGMGVLEIKTTSERYYKTWGDTIPTHYYIQLQHYLAITGYKYGYFAILVNGQQLHRIKIVRDEEAISEIFYEADKFWKNYIIPKIEPSIEVSAYQEELPETAKSADIDILELYNEIVELKAIIKEYQDKLDKKIEIAKELIGDKEEVIFDGVPIITYRSFERNQFDLDRFKKENPIIYQQYLKTISGRTFKVIEKQ